MGRKKLVPENPDQTHHLKLGQIRSGQA
jgi:hypothetical protein